MYVFSNDNHKLPTSDGWINNCGWSSSQDLMFESDDTPANVMITKKNHNHTLLYSLTLFLRYLEPDRSLNR